ncbi:MAG: hypothetical protein B6U78_00060 [Candidatus Aenigmarchaeota archaeon ex4484_224]|nr:MAG: hypothetical protein B6U78_00060 [Candidatus Aenigmarchaeota archaeon ex4484_224]
MKKIVFRGFLKAMILAILNKRRMHGYEIIKEIEKRTKFWKPSPGTIYPLLRKMEKEGLVKSSKKDKIIVYSLTKKGKSKVIKFEKLRKEIKEKFLEGFEREIGIKYRKIKKHRGLLKSHFKLILFGLIKNEKEIVKEIKTFDRKLKKLLKS